MKEVINKTRARNNLILISLNLIYVFGIGLFSFFKYTHYVYYTFISLIFLVSILTISDERRRAFIFPILIVILTWVTEMFNLPLLSTLTGLVSTLFFLVVIVLLIKRVAQSKRVRALEFLESINVYLLLGIAASLLLHAIYIHDPAAYNISGGEKTGFSDFIYYGFVTMTTVGYGDITPVNPLARSLSIFFSVAGQLYLTMIIALLVGKYLSQQVMNADEEG